jgi:hypothetical protein
MKSGLAALKACALQPWQWLKTVRVRAVISCVCGRIAMARMAFLPQPGPESNILEFNGCPGRSKELSFSA